MSVIEERDWTIDLAARNGAGEDERVGIRYRQRAPFVFVRKVHPLGIGEEDLSIPVDDFLAIADVIAEMAGRRAGEEPER